MIGTRSLAGTQTEEARFEVRTVAASTLKSWTGYLMLATVVAAVAVESLLAVRLWAQLTNQDVATGLLGNAYALSSDLVAPFHQGGETAIHSTGIFEVATLTAIEVYLIAALVTVAALFLLRQAFHLFATRRQRHLREAAFGDEAVLARQAASPR